MIDHSHVSHHIQKHILAVLIHQDTARFRDLRPPKVDTNLYSYHLKLLLKRELIQKRETGYTLGIEGLKYVDRLSAQTASPTLQPKLITMLVIQNGYGGILMYKKQRQPFIDQWTLPHGKMHNDDVTISAAAQREVREKIGDITIDLRHAGDCYIRVQHEQASMIATLVHVFYGTTESDAANEHLHWIDPHKLSSLELAPAMEQVIARTFFRDLFFFEEFTVSYERN